jgi:protein-tyrosine-phosphatase
MEQVNKIIFVCTGNTCRSPMAEALMRKEIGNQRIQVFSRGLMVICSEPANEMAIEIMADRGIDIKNHQSLPFDEDEIDEKTLILTMTQRHKTVLSQHELKGELYSIKEFAGSKGDVNDPYGGSIDVYKRCYDELESLIIKIGGLINDRNR